jgi:hypothetical protein
VIVPEEQVDLPVNQPLQVQIEYSVTNTNDQALRLAAVQRISSRAIDANLPAHALSRDSIYEDRR